MLAQAPRQQLSVISNLTPPLRAALTSVRAVPNPRSEDRRPKETRRPRSELRATPAEQQPIESGHSRNSDFGLPSGFGLPWPVKSSCYFTGRSSDFRAAEQDLPSTDRTLAQPWRVAVGLIGTSALGPPSNRPSGAARLPHPQPLLDRNACADRAKQSSNNRATIEEQSRFAGGHHAFASQLPSNSH